MYILNVFYSNVVLYIYDLLFEAFKLKKKDGQVV